VAQRSGVRKMKYRNRATPVNGTKRAISQEENLDSVAYLCRRIMTAALRDLQAMMPDVDVTIGQLGTLVLIARNPGITPTEICRAQGFEKPTITASLNKLESKKFIVRKASLSDRRSFAVHLTKKGHAFYREMLVHINESEQRLTRCLSGRDRAQLLQYLRRIFDHECKSANGQGIDLGSPARAQPEHKRGASALVSAPSRVRDHTEELGHRLKQMERQFVQLRKALRQAVRPAD